MTPRGPAACSLRTTYLAPGDVTYSVVVGRGTAVASKDFVGGVAGCKAVANKIFGPLDDRDLAFRGSNVVANNRFLSTLKALGFAGDVSKAVRNNVFDISDLSGDNTVGNNIFRRRPRNSRITGNCALGIRPPSDAARTHVKCFGSSYCVVPRSSCAADVAILCCGPLNLRPFPVSIAVSGARRVLLAR